MSANESTSAPLPPPAGEFPPGHTMPPDGHPHRIAPDLGPYSALVPGQYPA